MKKERNAILGVGLITVLLASCSQQPQSNLTVSGLDPQNFVADVKGKPTSLYTLKNSNGMCHKLWRTNRIYYGTRQK